MTREKKQQIPEDSRLVRVIACLMCAISITAGFLFGENPVPVLEFSVMQWAAILACIWISIIGSVLSYHFRHNQSKALMLAVKAACVLILLNLVRELLEENLVAQQFQYTRPLVHAIAATIAINCFELRTTSEILATALFGTFLLVVAATSGKSLIFAACVMTYLSLGTILLMLCCRSQSKESTPTTQPLVTHSGSRDLSRRAFVPAIFLPILSLLLFSFVPRLDPQADAISAHVRSFTTDFLYKLRQDVMNERDRDEQTHGAASTDRRRNFAGALKPSDHRTRQPEVSPDERASSTNTDNDTDKGRKGTTNGTDQNKIGQKTGSTDANSDTKLTSKAASALHADKQSSGQPGPIATDRTSGAAKTTAKGAVSPSNTAAQKNENASNTGVNKWNTSATKRNDAETGHSKIAARLNGEHKEPKPSSFGDIDKQPNQSGKAPATSAQNGTGSKAEETTTLSKGHKMSSPRKMDFGSGSAVAMSSETPDGNDVLFSFACNRNLYTKLATLSDFDGQVWTRPRSLKAVPLLPRNTGVIVFDEPGIATPSDALPIIELTETIELKESFGHGIPIGGLPQKMTLAHAIYADAMGDVFALENLPAGTEYSVLADVPVYSLADMRVAKTVPDDVDLDRFLLLPEDQSTALADLANKLTGDGGNRFSQAERIVTYLRKNYKCKAHRARQSAKKINEVDEFLFDTKSGDCKEFSSAFICLCRAAQIPARMVIGFSPGDPDPVSGAILVRKKHAHAWSEIYMPPYGWIPFDATPGGLLPARPEESYYNAQRIHKEIVAYSQSANSSASSSIRNVLSIGAKVIYVLLAALVAVALWLLGKEMPRLITSLHRMLHQHPATRLKHGVYKRLHRIGIETGPADSGGDVVRKVELLQQKPSIKPSRRQSSPELINAVAQFVSTYNAVYFGDAMDRIADLKQLSKQIHSLTK